MDHGGEREVYTLICGVWETRIVSRVSWLKEQGGDNKGNGDSSCQRHAANTWRREKSKYFGLPFSCVDSLKEQFIVLVPEILRFGVAKEV